ncbi:unnamed protein product [Oncorhynchus mykiss]|uniref:Uncharacterized protein n=1 Tax=Oncorhynchus mykiss TaxID=8022 RepID=A0A060W105_ONCMY|nr:unnamed protein product [Oncorhynchus mykiss]
MLLRVTVVDVCRGSLVHARVWARGRSKVILLHPHHQTYQDSCEEGTTKYFPPQETEKTWHGPPDPQMVLQLHHREHPDRRCQRKAHKIVRDSSHPSYRLFSLLLHGKRITPTRQKGKEQSKDNTDCVCVFPSTTHPLQHTYTHTATQCERSAVSRYQGQQRKQWTDYSTEYGQDLSDLPSSLEVVVASLNVIR